MISNSIYLNKHRKESKLSNFFEKEKIKNVWGFLNFMNRNENKVNGRFYRIPKYITKSLNLSGITLSEYKFYLWVIENTVGYSGNPKNEHSKNNRTETDLQYYKEIAEDLGMSDRNLYKTIDKLAERNMIYIGRRTFKKYTEKHEIKTVTFNPYPDTWEHVSPKVKEYIFKWIENAKQDMGWVKSNKRQKAYDKAVSLLKN